MRLVPSHVFFTPGAIQDLAVPFDFDIEALALRSEGRRFEAGTPSVAAVYPQLAGLERVQEVTRDLAEAGIIADARPGLVRLSPCFYNTPDDHAAALEVLAHG